MNDIQLQWLRQRSTRFETCHPQVALSFDEVAAIDQILGDATLVGLGEGTHGAKEIFEARNRLMRFLIQQRGFTIIILETCFANTLPLNRYVRDGEGTPTEALARTEYFSCVNQETLELVTWIRSYNGTQGNSRALQIFGCDVQSIDGPKMELARIFSVVRNDHMGQQETAGAMSLLEQLASDHTLYALVAPLLSELGAEHPDTGRIAAIQSQRYEFMTGVQKIARELSSRCREMQPRLASCLPPLDYFLFERCVRLIDQVVEFYFPDGLEKRDAFLAENVRAVQEFFRGKKCILAAHNLHLAHTPLIIRGERFVPAGSILASHLQNHYKVIASAYHHGSYLAAAGGRPVEDQVVVAHTPQANAFEYSLREFGEIMRTPNFLLDVSSESMPFPWAPDIEMRLGEAGAQRDYSSSFAPQRPDRQYDGLLFITEITPIFVLPEYYHRAASLPTATAV